MGKATKELRSDFFGAGRARRPTVEIGALIDGRYRITEEIGAGGFGRVFRAEHTALHREVALKLLTGPAGRSQAAGDRFRREAFAVGRLSHDNCVDVTDFAEGDDGALFLVMELLDGTPLCEAIAEGPLPAERALRIARHVLAGLAHAHAMGIVHRDIKPGNVFLIEREGDRDFAKILDFGIAKLVGDAVTEAGGNELTQDGFALGSPTYMSPEQATAAVIDGRSDLYSVSVLLYEMLTGRPPFFSEDKLAVLGMHMSRPAPRLADVAGQPFTAELESLLADGLAKSLDSRIASADEYIARIDAALGTMRQPAPAMVRAARPTPSRPMRWGAAAAALAGLALVAALAIPTGTTADADPVTPVAAAAPAPDLGELEDEPDIVAGDANATELAEIDRLIERGQRRAAKKKLLALQSSSQEAGVSLRLGHLYIRDMWWAEAFSAYRRAFELDPATRDDPRVIENAIRSLMSQRRPGLGERFIRDELGPRAIPQLRHASETASSRTVRRRAKRLLSRLERE